jgi:hypothetical protein
MMVGDANVNTVKSELKSSRVGLLWIHFKGVADEIRRLLIAFKRRKNIGSVHVSHSTSRRYKSSLDSDSVLGKKGPTAENDNVE